MNPSDSNFDELKRLLRLKQHEVPPPGYFQQFSGEVVARIRAGEAGGRRTMAEKLENEAPWVVRFLQIFETRPGLVGVFATCLCLLLMLGVLMADHSDTTTKDMLAGTSVETSETAVASLSSPLMASATPDAAATNESGLTVSTNSVTSLQPAATLFGEQPSLFQSASFTPAGH
jgi:hypothetical protein